MTLNKNIHSCCGEVTQVNVILFTFISIIRGVGGLVETYAIYSYCGEVTQAVFGPPPLFLTTRFGSPILNPRFGSPVLERPFWTARFGPPVLDRLFWTAHLLIQFSPAPHSSSAPQLLMAPGSCGDGLLLYLLTYP